jgi:hypothetical protein
VIVECVGLKRFLREEKFRNIDEKREGAGGSVVGRNKIAEDGPLFVGVFAMSAEMLSKEAIVGDGVVIAEEEDLAASGFYTEAAGGSGAPILLTDVAEIRIRKQEVAAEGLGVVGGAIVDHDDFPARSGEGLKSQGSEAEAELVSPIVGRDDEGEFEVVPASPL